jgi:hypothetical protein
MNDTPEVVSKFILGVKQKNPHPGPLPSDGRGSSHDASIEIKAFRLTMDALSCPLAHRMGEG